MMVPYWSKKITWVEENHPHLLHQPNMHKFNRYLITKIDIENEYGNHTYTQHLNESFMSLSFFSFHFIYMLINLLDWYSLQKWIHDLLDWNYLGHDSMPNERIKSQCQ